MDNRSDFPGGSGGAGGGPAYCVSIVMRSGFKAILNIHPTTEAHNVHRVLSDGDRHLAHLIFETNRNNVWINLEHLLFAELIDDATRDESPELKGAFVRYASGHERRIDLPEPDEDEEWGQTPAEALGFYLSFSIDQKSVSFQSEDATWIHLNTDAAEIILWARDEAYPGFDPVERAKRDARREKELKKASSDLKQTLEDLKPARRTKPKRR